MMTRGMYPIDSSGIRSAASPAKESAAITPNTQPAIERVSRTTPRTVPTIVESTKSAAMIQSISVM